MGKFVYLVAPKTPILSLSKRSMPVRPFAKMPNMKSKSFSRKKENRKSFARPLLELLLRNRVDKGLLEEVLPDLVALLASGLFALLPSLLLLLP